MSKSSSLITLVLLAVIFTASGLLIVFNFPSTVGKDEAFLVRSYSMEPNLSKGSMIFVKDVDSGEIEKGDVITYRKENSEESILITHRVVDISNFENHRYYRMKGDANNGPDPGLIGEHQVVGKISGEYPRLGSILVFLNTPLGFLSSVWIPSGIVILKEFTDIRRQLRLDKLKKARLN